MCFGKNESNHSYLQTHEADPSGKKHIKEEAVIVRQLVWVPQEKRVCLT